MNALIIDTFIFALVAAVSLIKLHSVSKSNARLKKNQKESSDYIRSLLEDITKVVKENEELRVQVNLLQSVVTHYTNINK